MRLTVFAVVLLWSLSSGAWLFTVTEAENATVVYRAADHVVALGTPTDGSTVLVDEDVTLDDFVLVTIRNDNGVLQATELGEPVYRDHRTLIVRLTRPMVGDFIRSDIFSVIPLREDRSPSEPIPIPMRSGYDDAVADIVAAVSGDSLISVTTNYENYITRYSASDGYDTACEWSSQRFTSYGLDSEIRHFTMQGFDCQNVIATQTGTVHPDQYWIICGHLDSTSPVASTNAPGADDNGSGSAAVVEAARIMSQYQFEYTIRYCLWGGEEQGLHGSAHYADSVAAAGDEILGVVNLDMIFYGPQPDDQGELHYNTASQALGFAFDAISDTYVPSLGKTVANPPVSASDHSSFWNQGYPAMLLIEKEVWNNPYYHQTTDVMSNYLQYFPFGTRMARAAIATVAYLAVPTGTSVEETSTAIPASFSMVPLSNPVGGNLAMAISLPRGETLTVNIFDAAGRMVRNGYMEQVSEQNTVSVDTRGLPAGIYTITGQTGNAVTSSARVVVLNN